MENKKCCANCRYNIDEKNYVRFCSKHVIHQPSPHAACTVYCDDFILAKLSVEPKKIMLYAFISKFVLKSDGAWQLCYSSDESCSMASNFMRVPEFDKEITIEVKNETEV